MRQLMKEFAENLRAGLALAMFRRREIPDFKVSPDQLVWLVFVGLLFEFCTDYLLSLPRPLFDAAAFQLFAFSFLLLLLAAYFYSHILKRREALLQFLVVTYSATFVFVFLQLAMKLMIVYGKDIPVWGFQAVWIVYFVWVIAVLLRSLYLVAEREKKTSALGFVVLTVVWLVPATMENSGERFWYPDTPDEEVDYDFSAYRKLDGEAVMYAQPELLQRSLEQLKPGHPGVTDLYFIGFAPYAMQDVFSKEVHYAQKVMDNRYGTAGRSLLFINSLKSTNELPLASATNLARALKYLSSIMNEEDVLMIYLTSHGSRKKGLAVDFWPLPLNDIKPAKLREMLDEAGIKWRVVIVSACYSGTFVEPLKEEHTLVATASAPDRTSFGCSNERDFTYYGEALFKDELLHSDSLLDAFRHAPLTVSRKERKEDLEPSRPQLYLTPAVEDKLHGIVRRECLPESEKDNPLSC